VCVWVKGGLGQTITIRATATGSLIIKSMSLDESRVNKAQIAEIKIYFTRLSLTQPLSALFLIYFRSVMS